MDKQAFLNNKYLAFCQQLGDAQIQRDQLDSHIENLKSKIKTLNEAFPLIVEFENVNKNKPSEN